MDSGQAHQILSVLSLDLVCQYLSLVLGHKTEADFTPVPSNSQRGSTPEASLFRSHAAIAFEENHKQVIWKSPECVLTLMPKENLNP